MVVFFPLAVYEEQRLYIALVLVVFFWSFNEISSLLLQTLFLFLLPFFFSFANGLNHNVELHGIFHLTGLKTMVLFIIFSLFSLWFEEDLSWYHSSQSEFSLCLGLVFILILRLKAFYLSWYRFLRVFFTLAFRSYVWRSFYCWEISNGSF